MQTNRFFKNDPKCKDLIMLLKTYLVGTDTILRIWDTQSSFDVLFSKFTTNQLRGYFTMGVFQLNTADYLFMKYRSMTVELMSVVTRLLSSFK